MKVLAGCTPHIINIGSFRVQRFHTLLSIGESDRSFVEKQIYDHRSSRVETVYVRWGMIQCVGGEPYPSNVFEPKGPI